MLLLFGFPFIVHFFVSSSPAPSAPPFPYTVFFYHPNSLLYLSADNAVVLEIRFGEKERLRKQFHRCFWWDYRHTIEVSEYKKKQGIKMREKYKTWMNQLTNDATIHTVTYNLFVEKSFANFINCAWKKGTREKGLEEAKKKTGRKKFCEILSF